jgi:aspartate/methionine/tyrosine aminotransferase
MSLLSDEVFFDFPIEDAADKVSTAGHKECLTFTMGGISKALALPQMKLSWIIVSGPDDLVQEAVKRLEMIADTYLSVSTPIQNALSSLFAMKDPIQASISGRINDNYRHLKELFKGHPKADVLKTEGGWYAVLEMKDMDEDTLVSRLLSEKDLFVHPGFFYEFHEGSHLVLSLLPSAEVFAQGLKKLKDFLG